MHPTLTADSNFPWPYVVPQKNELSWWSVIFKRDQHTRHYQAIPTGALSNRPQSFHNFLLHLFNSQHCELSMQQDTMHRKNVRYQMCCQYNNITETTGQDIYIVPVVIFHSKLWWMTVQNQIIKQWCSWEDCTVLQLYNHTSNLSVVKLFKFLMM